MAKVTFSSRTVPYAQYEIWRDICPEGHWKRLSPSALRGLLPHRLLSKANAVFILSSASAAHSAFVANINRVDPPASAIDQEAFFATFDHSASTAQGHFVHHGGWTGRTILPGSSFFEAIGSSGIEHHFPYGHMPQGSSGLLTDLAAHPEAGDFWQDMKSLRQSSS